MEDYFVVRYNNGEVGVEPASDWQSGWANILAQGFESEEEARKASFEF